jgi:hypothetical protein
MATRATMGKNPATCEIWPEASHRRWPPTSLRAHRRRRWAEWGRFWARRDGDVGSDSADEDWERTSSGDEASSAVPEQWRRPSSQVTLGGFIPRVEELGGCSAPLTEINVCPWWQGLALLRTGARSASFPSSGRRLEPVESGGARGGLELVDRRAAVTSPEDLLPPPTPAWQSWESSTEAEFPVVGPGLGGLTPGPLGGLLMGCGHQDGDHPLLRIREELGPLSPGRPERCLAVALGLPSDGAEVAQPTPSIWLWMPRGCTIPP